jgi:hypothetical protein
MAAVLQPTWLDLGALKGADGTDAYTTTTAGFVQPAAAPVSVSVVDTSWMAVGQPIFVAGGGAYTVAAITDATHVSLTNTGATGNAGAGATVAGSAKVSPSGPKGADGTNGGIAYQVNRGSVAVGDVVVSASSGSTSKFAKALAAAYAAAPGSLAIALTIAIAPAVPTVAGPGAIVPATTTGLDAGAGAGTACLVSWDLTTARCVRLGANPDPTRPVVGVCDDAGNLTVLPRSHVGTAPVHVKDIRLKGAVIDATTDCQPAMAGAQQELPSGGVLYVPGSSSSTKMLSSLPLNQPNVSIRGDSRDRSVILAPSITALVWAGSGLLKTLVIEDVTFDGGGTAMYAANLNVGGEAIDEVIVRRCRFKNMPGGRALWFGGCKKITIEDNDFDGGASGGLSGTAEGVYIYPGCIETLIQRNQFRACLTGIGISAGSNAAAQVFGTSILNNKFDGGFYTLPKKYSSTASYAAGSLTDAGTDFSAGGLGFVFAGFVRVLAGVRVSGTGTFGVDYTGALIDSGKDFRTYGILPGEIVRCGTHQAVVQSVDNGRINVDGWFDTTNYAPTRGPGGSVAYTVYKLALAYIDTTGLASGTHTVSVLYGSWLDCAGNAFTPPNGSTYELVPRTIYQIQVSGGARDTLVQGNSITRPWADGISTFSDHTRVLGNTVSWTQDQGITVTAAYCEVAGNEIYMAGRGGIFGGCSYSNIHDNIIRGWGWTSTSAQVPGLSYAFQVTALKSDFHGNQSDGMSLPSATQGIAVLNGVGCNVYDNPVRNLPAGARSIWVVDASGSSATGAYIRHDDVVSCDAGQGWPAGRPIVDLRLPAGSAPAGLQKSLPGGRVICADGNEYVKARNNDETGWQVATLIEPPAWLATAISGCLHWSRAGDTSKVLDSGGVPLTANGLVNSIIDGGSLALNATAATSAQRMAYTAKDATCNNRGTIALGGVTGLKTAAFTRAQAFSFVVVVKYIPAGAPQYGMIMSDRTAALTQAFASYGSAVTWGSNAGNSVASPLVASGAWGIMVFTFNGPASHAKYYESPSGNTPVLVGTTSGTGGLDGLTLGNDASFTHPGQAQVEEWALYDHELTDAEVRLAMIGLSAYCAIPLGRLV